MGTFKLAVKLLFKDFNKSAFYCGSLLFSSAVIFVFFNMMANPVYGGATTFAESANSFGSSLSIIVVIIAMVMVFFANSFYLISKSKELAITTISGGNVLSLAGFLFTQNAIIMLIAIPLGLTIGYFINPVINTAVYDVMGVSANSWAIYPIGIIYTIISIATETVWIVLIDTGYAYRSELNDLLTAERTMKVKDERTMKLPSFVYYILFFGPLVLILSNEVLVDVYIFYALIGSCGVIGIMKFSLPKILSWFQNRFCLAKKHMLIAIGNLNHSLKQSSSLIIVNVATFSFLACYLCNFFNQTNYLVMILMACGVLSFLMAVSFVYKIMIEASARIASFKHLRMLGYISKDIKKIVRIEIIGLGIVIIGLPLLYIVAIFYKSVEASIISFSFALSIILGYIAVFLVSCVISYFVYCNLVMKGRGR